MTVTRIPFTTEEAWLAERAKDITSTEIAALYGLSPYCTAFELWHQKQGLYVEDFESNDRIKWGTRLQDAIAAGVAEDMGWEAKRLDDYMRDDDARLGASFDFEVVCQERGRVPGGSRQGLLVGVRDARQAARTACGGEGDGAGYTITEWTMGTEAQQ